MKKNILSYIIIYGILFGFINLILNTFNIKFMNWIYYLSYIFVILGIIIGIYQLILKIKNKNVKKCIMVLNTVINIIIIGMTISIFKFIYTPEYVIIKNNKKVVAEVQMYSNTHIDYYQYINFFMKSKNNIDSEYYSEGGHNPFKTDLNYIKLLK